MVVEREFSVLWPGSNETHFMQILVIIIIFIIHPIITSLFPITLLFYRKHIIQLYISFFSARYLSFSPVCLVKSSFFKLNFHVIASCHFQAWKVNKLHIDHAIILCARLHLLLLGRSISKYNAR
jgi:hypothetical protein